MRKLYNFATFPLHIMPHIANIIWQTVMEDFTLSEPFQEVDAEIFFIISMEVYLTRFGNAASQKRLTT